MGGKKINRAALESEGFRFNFLLPHALHVMKKKPNN